MNLNVTQLKDLEYICQLAEERLMEPFETGAPKEQQWLERIRKYRALLNQEHDLQGERILAGARLYVDPDRTWFQDSSKIFVRAFDPSGKPVSVDIACLKLSSLLAWLRSRGGENEWAENAVAKLLGHELPAD